MKNFMIGQFNEFSMEKYERDFREEFFGIEACNMRDYKEIQKLKKVSSNDGFKIGVHFPLRKDQWKYRDPQYMSGDHIRKKESYEYIANELKFCKDIDPEYVLLHYPKPVVLSENCNWERWAFADDTEYIMETDISLEKFKRESEEFFGFIQNKAEENNIRVVLELDAVNKYLWETNILEELLEKHHRVKLCLDLGRLHLQDMLHKEFDPFKLIDKYLKYTEVVHLSNTMINKNELKRHQPTLETLSIHHGWADVRKYMNEFKKKQDIKYLFEHNSSIISDKELEECYRWIDDLLK